MGSDIERTGFLFLAEDERLVDVMNDDRTFLPFKSEDGRFSVIKKSAIIEISIKHEGGRSRLSRY
jgi:hypothetical protein